MAYVKDANGTSYIFVQDDGTETKVAGIPPPGVSTTPSVTPSAYDTGTMSGTEVPAAAPAPEKSAMQGLDDFFRISNPRTSTSATPQPSPVASAVATTAPTSMEVPEGIRRPDELGTPSPMPKVPDATGASALMKVQESTTSNGFSQRVTDPAILAEQKKLSDRNAVLAKDAGDVSEKVLLEQGDKFKSQAAVKDEAAQLREQGAAAQKEMFANYNNNLSAALKDYEETQIVPKGIFDGGVGDNILAAVALTLGGLGAGLTGTHQNVALSIMEKSIDRDIEAQKANLGKKREAISMLGVKYQAARQAGLDDTQAKLLAKAETYDQIALYYDQKRSQLEAPQAKANAEAMSNKIKEEALSKRAELTVRTVNSTTQTQTKTTATPVKKLEAKEREEIRGASKMIAEAERLKALLVARELGGPAAGRVLKAQSLIGLPLDDEEARFVAGTAEIAENIVYKLSGAASSEAQYNRYRMLIPTVEGDPKTNISKLNRLIENAQADINAYGVKSGEVVEGGYTIPDFSTKEQRDQKLGAKKVGK